MRSPGSRLRVLTVTHNYPRFTGDPAGAFVARVAEGVAELGHEVDVVAPHAPGTAVEEQVRGVRLHRFRYAPEFLERVAYTGGLHQGALRSPLVVLGLPGFLLSFGRAVRTAVGRLNPHLIHAHWWFPAGWYASRSRVPYVITSHGSDVRLLERSTLVRRRAERVFRGAGRVTAVSRFLAGDIVRLLRASVGVAVTPMPVEVSSFLAGSAVPKARPYRVLYAGNLVRSKGVDLLLRAAAELNRRGVEYQVKILGQGPEEASLRALARQLGLDDTRIIWSGFVPQDQMPGEYGASTVTVLASRGSTEGLGLTLVEALLAGSAVVGTPAGGIPEVVQHEQTGLLARDGDWLSLADQIERLLTDAALRDRLVGAGKEYALRTYSPEAAVRRFVEIYHAITDDQPNR